jgi:cobalt-zinc-cadmium efflux system membrane fusion protein
MSSTDLERHRSSRIWLLAVTGLIGVALGIRIAGWLPGLAIWRSGSTSSAAKQAEEAAAANQMLIRKGETIFIPEGSPYRERLKIAAVEAQTVQAMRVLPANVEADATRTVSILPPVTGRVLELKVRLGDEVKQGQALAVLDSGDLAQAYADDDKARAQLELTRLALQRAQGLQKFGGGARKDLEQAQSDFAEAQAEFNRTQARLKQIGASADVKTNRVLTITSPTDGVITSISTAPGAFLNDATAAIMTVADLRDVWVTANVPEKDLSFVSKGQPVDVTLPAYPGEVFHGKVDIVSDVLEPDTRRNKVRIVFDNPEGKLKPNMFATVTFLTPPEQKLTVPTSALVMNNDAINVFVETAPWTFVRRAVQPEAEIDDKAPIRKGLKAGERIVISGGVLLND